MGAKKIKCVESGCMHYLDGGCGYQWLEPPSPVPRGQMTREYCHLFAEKAGDEIRVSMNAFN
ncbi:MAG: hypothetical protein ACM3ZA_11895 [Bacillota bacterium]